MRILLINYEFPPLGGGAGNASYFIARELAGLGHDITVLTSGFKGLPAQEELDGFKIVRVPVIRQHLDRCTVVEMSCFILSAIWHSGAVIRQTRPQRSLIFFGIPGGPVGLWLKLRYGLPYVLSLRGGDVPGGCVSGKLRFYHGLTACLSHLIWRQALAVSTNGKRLKTLAKKFEPKLEIIAVSNGVDSDRYRPQAAVNLANSPLRLIYVGRLDPQKGLAYLLEALASLPEVPIHLELVGDGPQHAELKSLVQRHGLSDYVAFKGWVDRIKLPAVYQQGKIFVLPSLDEGLSNAMLEAMAAGLPVIATTVLAAEGLIEEGVTGFLVKPGNVQALASRLAWFSENPERIKDMGQQARTRVETGFSWNSTARACLRLLEKPA